MLKWKRVSVTAVNGTEQVEDFLAGMSGKNRVIKFFFEGDRTASTFLRLYRDAEQIVDIEADLLTANAPMLPMDLPLAEGQLCKAGFYNTSGGDLTRSFSIGYEETG